MSWIQAAIAAGASHINAIYSGVQNKRQAQKDREQSIYNINATYDRQMELARYQNDRNLELWHATNDYNSPEAQRQRLEAAGLNPNLMYQQGNLGNAGSPPATVAPSYSHDEASKPVLQASFDTNSYFNVMQQIVAIQRMRKQNELLQEQIDNISDITQLRRERVNNESLRGLHLDERRRFQMNQNLLWENRNASGLVWQREADIDKYYRHRSDYINTRRENAILEGAMKSWEISLNRSGLTKTDPYPYRIFHKYVNSPKFQPSREWLNRPIF